MSTLKAARADNFYYAPDGADWAEQRRRMRKTPKKARNYFKSASVKYIDSEPNDALEPFQRGAGRGAVIRFEMPFKVICLKCECYIAKGVRFDAERKAIGKYFSTTIYAFLMSCHQCHNPIVIQTDPENTTYLCKTGVRIKVESFDVADANTLELGHSHDTKQQLLSNPLYKLECMALEAASGVSDPVESKPATTRNAIARYKGPTQIQESGTRKLNPDTSDKTVIDDKLDELLAINEINNADWYLSNAALRRKFRNEKKQLRTNPNVMVDLLPENERDVQEAKRVTFLSQSKKIKAHFKSILKKDTGIFSRTCGSSSGRGSTIEDKKRRLQFIKHIDTRLKHRV